MNVIREATQTETALVRPDCPAGFAVVLVADESFRVVRDDERERPCRMPRCERPAVAVLLRKRRDGAVTRWFCCPVHLYGRTIENGVVLGYRLRER